MQTKCFEIDAAGRMNAVEHGDAVRDWRSGGGPYWIDFESRDSPAPARVLGQLGLDEETVGRLLEPGHAARVLPLEEALFFEFPLRFSGEPPELESVSFVCLDRLLVTFHRIPLSHATPEVDSLLSRLALGDPSTNGLVTALLIEWSVELRQLSSQPRRKAFELARKLDADPEGVTIEEILDLRREILALDAVSDERASVLELLAVVKRPFFDPTKNADRFRTVDNNTSATSRRADRLDRRIADLQSRYDSIQQEKTNRRLSRLTIISAIFLPLTLLAGIYGMNFDVMPELHYPLAYPLVLGGMVLIALGLNWWFRSRGWLD